MTRIVKNAFTYRFGHGGTVNVPAGARVERHDATYYGIRVPLDNTEEA